MQTFKIEPSWQAVLADELQKPYISDLIDFLKQEYEGPTPIYPQKTNLFQALWKTPFEKVKVVIVGQDPYHGPGQANGLCFSVPQGTPLPPSLQNIFKELQDDLGKTATSGSLEHWASQGVLLLNTVLSVRQGQAFSHRGRGWERFTDAIVEKLGQNSISPVFILWGSAAQQKCLYLRDSGKVPAENFLMAPHPSPLSCYRGFYGSRPFSRANALLIKQGLTPIDW